MHSHTYPHQDRPPSTGRSNSRRSLFWYKNLTYLTSGGAKRGAARSWGGQDRPTDLPPTWPAGANLARAVRRWHDGEALSGRAGRPSHADALPDEPTPAPRPRLAPAPTPAFGGEAASKQNLAKAELARKISIAKKNELEVAAEKALRELGLDQKIRDARGFAALIEINQEIAALLASGTLLPSRGQAIQRLMAEARQDLLAQQQAGQEHADQRTFLCTEEGGLLLRVFEGIVSDPRREVVLRVAKEQAVADLREHPDVDTGAAA